MASLTAHKVEKLYRQIELWPGAVANILGMVERDGPYDRTAAIGAFSRLATSVQDLQLQLYEIETDLVRARQSAGMTDAPSFDGFTATTALHLGFQIAFEMVAAVAMNSEEYWWPIRDGDEQAWPALRLALRSFPNINAAAVRSWIRAEMVAVVREVENANQPSDGDLRTDEPTAPARPLTILQRRIMEVLDGVALTADKLASARPRMRLRL